MTVIPEVLELIQPVIGQSGLDVSAVCVGKETAYCFVVGFPGWTIEGGVGAIRDEGERRFGSHGWHLRCKAQSMKGL